MVASLRSLLSCGYRSDHAHAHPSAASMETLEPRILLSGSNDVIASAIDLGRVSEQGVIIQQSDELGSDESGAVSAGLDDVDMYRLDVLAGYEVRITTSAQPGRTEVDTFLRVFDESGSQRASNDDGGSGLYSQVTDSFGDGLTLYIGVSGFSNSSYNPVSGAGLQDGDTGFYTLTIEVVRLNDTLDTAIDAGTLAFLTGQFFTQRIDRDIADDMTPVDVGVRDVDMYRFELEAHSGVRLETSLPSGSTDPVNTWLRLFDETGFQLTSDDDSGAGNYSRIDRDLAPGTYYLGVSSRPNRLYLPTEALSGLPGGDGGDYTLLISLSGVYGLDNTLDTATDLGLFQTVGQTETRSDTIGVDGAVTLSNGSTDVDMYRFTVASEGAGEFSRFRIRTANLSGGLMPFMRVFDGQGNQLSDNIGGGGSQGALLELGLGLAFDGVIYVGISGNGNETYDPTSFGGPTDGLSEGGYDLIIEAISIARPDDTITTATDLGVFSSPGQTADRQGRIGTDAGGDQTIGGSDVDMYRIFLSESGRVRLGTTTVEGQPPLDSVLRLFNGSGNQIFFDDDSGPGLHAALDVELAAGTYYVGVSGFGNPTYDQRAAGTGESGGREGDYTLTVQLIDPAAAELQTSMAYYPEGFASDAINQTVYVTNHTDSTQIFSLLLRYESNARGQDVIARDQALAPGQRLAIDVARDGVFATDDDTGRSILGDEPYALVLNATAPLSASIEHSDAFNGRQMGTAEDFTTTTDTQWFFARVTKQPGVNQFIVLYNPNDHTVDVLLLFQTAEGFVPITQTLAANERGGLNIQATNALADGAYGLRVLSSASMPEYQKDHQGIVAAQTSFDPTNGHAWSTLGHAGTLPTTGDFNGAARPQVPGMSTDVYVYNPFEISTTVRLFRLDGTTSERLDDRVIAPGDSLLISLGDQGIGYRYQFIVSTAAVQFVQSTSTSATSTINQTAATAAQSIGFSLGQFDESDSESYLRLSVFNGGTDQAEVTVRLVFLNGTQISRMLSIDAGAFGILAIDGITSARAEAASGPLGVILTSTSPVAGMLASYDASMLVDWTSSGTSLAT